MDIFDVLVVLSWVLVVITLCVGGSLMMGADWREMWTQLTRRR